MHFCPQHIEDSVVTAADKFSDAADESHHYFQLICNQCSFLGFHVFVGTKRTIKALCSRCSREVVVYDLALYPGAFKSRGDEAFSELNLTRDEPLPVHVGYEYGEFDDDQEFDQNEITWCRIFVEKHGEMIEFFNDETA